MENSYLGAVLDTFSLDGDSKGYPIVALSFNELEMFMWELSTETNGIETAVV